MVKRASKLFSLIIVMGAFLLSLGCLDVVQVGKLQTESQSVEKGEAETVQVEIKMGTGSLKIGGGADNLMNADFTYNVAEWKPEVNYQVKDNIGKLTISQKSDNGMGKLPLGKARNGWDLRFNNNVPMKLKIDLGAGENHLHLGPLSLTSLDIGMGAGELDLDLSGTPSLKKLNLNMGVGDVTVDLTGDWKNDLAAQINNGIGRISLCLPDNVGIFASAERGIGQVSACGFKRHGSTYYNDAYEESDVTLNLNVDAGIGQINLETVKQ
jgi:hypothetical protein